eukprot:04755_4
MRVKLALFLSLDLLVCRAGGHGPGMFRRGCECCCFRVCACSPEYIAKRRKCCNLCQFFFKHPRRSGWNIRRGVCFVTQQPSQMSARSATRFKVPFLSLCTHNLRYRVSLQSLKYRRHRFILRS